MYGALAPLVHLALKVDEVVAAQGEDDAGLLEQVDAAGPLGAVVAVGAARGRGGGGSRTGTMIARLCLHVQYVAVMWGKLGVVCEGGQ